MMGPEGKWVEVQIRSTRMDEIAERGYAAHWKYKGEYFTGNRARQMDQKDPLMLENPLADPIEFLDEIQDEPFLVGDNGIHTERKAHKPSKGASALDFAYEIQLR